MWFSASMLCFPGLKSWHDLLVEGNFEKFCVTALSLNFLICDMAILTITASVTPCATGQPSRPGV